MHSKSEGGGGNSNIYQIGEFWRGGVRNIFKALSHKRLKPSESHHQGGGGCLTVTDVFRDRPIYNGNPFEQAVVEPLP